MNDVEHTLRQYLDAARQPLSEARHMPADLYTSEEVFRLDKEKIFGREWICVGRTEEVEKPGDYLTPRIAGEPVIVTRDKEGELQAFSNICTHRGTEIALGRGNTHSFVCPYHGWSYNLKGELTGAGKMKGSSVFKPEECRLPTVKIDTWAGWIFVNFDLGAASLKTSIAAFVQRFGFLHQERCRLSNTYATEWNCNWKIATENLTDVYHLKVAHARTFGQYVTPNYPVTMEDGGGFSVFYEGSSITPDGQSLFGKMPWLNDRSDRFTCIGYLPPNMVIIGMSDMVRVYLVYPLAVNKTLVAVHTLFPAEVLSRSDFLEKAQVYEQMQPQIIDEDRSILQRISLGSSRFRPGPMSSAEITVHHVIREYLERVLGETRQVLPNTDLPSG